MTISAGSRVCAAVRRGDFEGELVALRDGEDDTFGMLREELKEENRSLADIQKKRVAEELRW